MSTSRLKSLAFATIAAVVLTIVVRSQFGEESFFCDGSVCELGSGTRWLLTGLVVVGTFIGTAGFRWSAMLERRGSLDPAAKWAIPDAEQIIEVATVIGAGLASYWLLLNGPSIEADDVRQVNQWANDLRNFRREENTAPTDLVPTSFTWFVVGGVLSLPFAFSFGSMIGREFFGRRRRKLQRSTAAPTETEPFVAGAPMLGRAAIDVDDHEFPQADADLNEFDLDNFDLDEFDLDEFDVDLDRDLDEAMDADD